MLLLIAAVGLVNPKAGLRLDNYAQVMKGNIEGPVVKANDLEGSNLYRGFNSS